jgi:hypothetical protein
MEKVKAALLVEDMGVYPRFAVDQVYVRRLAEALLAGESLPPVIADRKSMRIVDGFHRRRAYIAAYGPDVEIPVIWKSYRNLKEMFLDVIRFNARHGRRLTTGEEVRCVLIGEELGIEREVISETLGIRREVLDARVERKVAEGPVTREVLKPAITHLSGTRLTPEQVEVNRKLGGYRAHFFANQLLLLIRSECLNVADERLRSLLKDLYEELGNLLSRESSPVG